MYKIESVLISFYMLEIILFSISDHPKNNRGKIVFIILKVHKSLKYLKFVLNYIKMAELKKRETAYKLRIGDVLKATQIFEENESLNKRLKFVELGNKRILRVNIVANIIDKYESETESKFASLTLDDGSGQIKLRVFGEEMQKIRDLTQGNTIVVIGLLRSYNQELYIMPEIMKKLDPKYLLVRKLEIQPLKEDRSEIKSLRDELIKMIKDAEVNEGIDKEQIIMINKANPKIISQEIQKLLEEGVIYEPRPGRVRYLG